MVFKKVKEIDVLKQGFTWGGVFQLATLEWPVIEGRCDY